MMFISMGGCTSSYNQLRVKTKRYQGGCCVWGGFHRGKCRWLRSHTELGYFMKSELMVHVWVRSQLQSEIVYLGESNVLLRPCLVVFLATFVNLCINMVCFPVLALPALITSAGSAIASHLEIDFKQVNFNTKLTIHASTLQ